MTSTKDFKAFGQDIQKRLTDLENKTASMLTKTTADGLYLGKTATASAASKLTTSSGSVTNPVYFLNGVPVKTTYTLEKSVPADAKFTDTKYTAASSSNLGLVKVGSHITGASDGTISITKENVTSALGYTPPTTNTEYGNFSGATSNTAGTAGLVPAPTSGKTNQVLRSNGSWEDETVQTTITGNAGSATKLQTARNIGLTGDTTATAVSFDGSKDISLSTTLASITTAGTIGSSTNETLTDGGTFTIPYVTKDAKGRVTGGGTRTMTMPAAQTTITGNAGSATKLQTARYIDGISFDGTADIANYGTCSTAAATKDKVVACTGFALKTGARIIVKFTVTNTVTPTADAPITLNVNGTGAKNVFYHGSAAWSAGYLSANRLVEFVYDGTQYAVVGDWDTNNRYSNMTAATASAAGKAGLVPAPAAGAQGKFLRGDGTWQTPTNTTYSAATDSTLGLVKVGSNITNSSGTISVTKENVTSALGYTPPTTNTTYAKGVYNTLGLIKPSKSYTTAATLTTAAASATTAPTIAAISTTTGRYYAVEQDVNGVPFVNVPWTNSTYSNMTAATASAAGKAGLVPAPAAGAQGKFLRGDGTWQTPANTNNAVTQTVKTDNVNYPIIVKGTNATATITGGVNFAAAITLNPSTGTINATKFNGALDAANLTGTIDGGTL